MQIKHSVCKIGDRYLSNIFLENADFFRKNDAFSNEGGIFYSNI